MILTARETGRFSLAVPLDQVKSTDLLQPFNSIIERMGLAGLAGYLSRFLFDYDLLVAGD